jgi:hypothetical protein
MGYWNLPLLLCCGLFALVNQKQGVPRHVEPWVFLFQALRVSQSQTIGLLSKWHLQDKGSERISFFTELVLTFHTGGVSHKSHLWILGLCEVWAYLAARIVTPSPEPSGLPCDGVFRFPSSSQDARDGLETIHCFSLFLQLLCNFLPSWYLFYDSLCSSSLSFFRIQSVLCYLLIHRVKMIDASNLPSCPTSLWL